MITLSTQTIRVTLTPEEFQNITTAIVNTRQKRPGISKMAKKLPNHIMDICLYSPMGRRSHCQVLSLEAGVKKKTCKRKRTTLEGSMILRNLNNPYFS